MGSLSEQLLHYCCFCLQNLLFHAIVLEKYKEAVFRILLLWLCHDSEPFMGIWEMKTKQAIRKIELLGLSGFGIIGR